MLLYCAKVLDNSRALAQVKDMVKTRLGPFHISRPHTVVSGAQMIPDTLIPRFPSDWDKGMVQEVVQWDQSSAWSLLWETTKEVQACNAPTWSEQPSTWLRMEHSTMRSAVSMDDISIKDKGGLRSAPIFFCQSGVALRHLISHHYVSELGKA